MEAAEPWKHANSRNEGCKEQNHGCMQAAEMKHARSRTMVAAELWKHASSRTMDCSSIEYM